MGSVIIWYQEIIWILYRKRLLIRREKLCFSWWELQMGEKTWIFHSRWFVMSVEDMAGIRCSWHTPFYLYFLFHALNGINTIMWQQVVVALCTNWIQKLEKKSNADLQWKYGRNIYGESIRDVIHTVIAVIVDMKQPKTLITAPNVAIVFKSVFWGGERSEITIMALLY